MFRSSCFGHAHYDGLIDVLKDFIPEEVLRKQIVVTDSEDEVVDIITSRVKAHKFTSEGRQDPDGVIASLKNYSPRRGSKGVTIFGADTIEKESQQHVWIKKTIGRLFEKGHSILFRGTRDSELHELARDGHQKFGKGGVKYKLVYLRDGREKAPVKGDQYHQVYDRLFLEKIYMVSGF